MVDGRPDGTKVVATDFRPFGLFGFGESVDFSDTSGSGRPRLHAGVFAPEALSAGKYDVVADFDELEGNGRAPRVVKRLAAVFSGRDFDVLGMFPASIV